MSIYSQNAAERDSTVYSKGYGRPMYDDRPEWSSSSYSNNRREFGNRGEQGADFRFSRSSRWGERDSYRNEMSPSPKRRRLRDDLENLNGYHKGKRPVGSNPPTSNGSLPSSSSNYDYRPSSGIAPTNYYDSSNYRSSYEGDSTYRRDRDYEYDRENRERYDRDRYDWYSRRGERTRPSMLMNSFRSDPDGPSSYSNYSENQYDREQIYLSRDHNRDKDRGSRSEARNEGNWNQGTQGQTLYSPTQSQSSESDSESEDEEQEQKNANSDQLNEREEPSAEQPLDAESATPTPKKRLGWGKGLVAFEKAKEEPSPTLGSDSRPPPIQDESILEENQEQKPSSTEENITPPPTIVQPEIEEIPQLDSIQEEEKAISDAPSNVAIKLEEEIKVEEPVKETKEPSQTKEELVQLLEKLDSEIIKTEQIIQNLKKPKKAEQKHVRPTHHNLVQSVYEENKQRVASVLEENPILVFPTNCPTSPTFTNPFNLPLFQKNIDSHKLIMNDMERIIRNLKIECSEKNESLTNEYIKLHETWKKKVVKMEAKRERKEEKKRSSQSPANLPPLRPQEEDMPSFGYHRRPIILRSTNARNTLSNSNGGVTTSTRNSNRFGHGDSVKSEAEFEEIMNQLREDGEQHDPFHRYRSTVASIPDMILKERRLPLFSNNNGIVEDPMVIEREKKVTNPWTEEERTTFVEYFLKFPKNFGEISARIPKKSTRDVVYFYYTNKKALELKKLLREHQNKKRMGRGRYNTSRENLIPLLTSATSPQIDPSNRTPKPRSTTNSVLASATALFQPQEETPPPIRRSTSQSNMESGTEEGRKEKEKRVFWTDKEKSAFLKSLKLYGKNWKRIAVEIPTKTASQVKNYFQNYKNKLNLHLLLQENDVAQSGGKKKTRRLSRRHESPKNEDDDDESSSSSEEDNQEIVSPEQNSLKNEVEIGNDAESNDMIVETSDNSPPESTNAANIPIKMEEKTSNTNDVPPEAVEVKLEAKEKEGLLSTQTETIDETIQMSEATEEPKLEQSVVLDESVMSNSRPVENIQIESSNLVEEIISNPSNQDLSSDVTTEVQMVDSVKEDNPADHIIIEEEMTTAPEKLEVVEESNLVEPATEPMDLDKS